MTSTAPTATLPAAHTTSVHRSQPEQPATLRPLTPEAEAMLADIYAERDHLVYDGADDLTNIPVIVETP